MTWGRYILLNICLMASMMPLMMTAHAAVGRLEAADVNLEAGEQWLSPTDSSAIISCEVRCELSISKYGNKESGRMPEFILSDQEGRRVICVIVSAGAPAMTEDSPRRLYFEISAYDESIYMPDESVCRTVITDVDESTAFTVSFESDAKGTIAISAGNTTLSQVGSFLCKGVPVSLSVTAGDSPLKILSVNIKCAESYESILPLMTAETVRYDEYEYLDRETLLTGVRLGGYYRIGLSPRDDGGFDIIYLSGADENCDVWHKGMLKGRLIPTIFQNHYNLVWRYADGIVEATDLWGELNGPILDLHFPRDKSRLRFSLIPPSR